MRSSLAGSRTWCPPVENAAVNILFHINPDEAESKHGRVFKEREDHPQSDYWKDPANGERLWAVTEEMLKGKTR